MPAEAVQSDFIEAVADRVAEKVMERLAEMGRPASKRLLSLRETGEYMGGKTARAIAHMVKDGTLPQQLVKRFGERRIFIDRLELDKWIATQ
jgi:predicted DNA-binding transcriptional regulator AlpA